MAKLHSKSKGNYNVGSVLKMIELYQLLKKHKNEKNIVHFLNGERDIRYLGFFKRKFPNTKFCATFHKPPGVLKETISNTFALRKLDGAIAVGTNQVDFLKDWLQLENVAYVPHGVDTQFFVPDISTKKTNTLLFVGQHLRDFDTLNTTIVEIAKSLPALLVNVVVHPAYSGSIKPHASIKLLTKVNDEKLRTLYQEASLLYLPMLDSTACNSLLEAMACGLPIITSAVGGNEAYLDGTSNVLVALGNVKVFVIETLTVLEDQNRLLEMGKSSRVKALQLDWNEVAEVIDTFYKNLD